MLSRVLGFAAASALGATAFLIPAGITPPENIEDIAFPFFEDRIRLVRLPCSACAFPYPHASQSDRVGSDEADDVFWAQGSANDVILRFTISDSQTLEVNGQAIYPTKFMALAESPFVEQVPASVQSEDVHNGDARLLEVTSHIILFPGEEETEPFGEAVIPIQYIISSLEYQPMQFDQVSVTLLRTAQGELRILDVDTVPSKLDPTFLPVTPISSDANDLTAEPTSEDSARLPPFFQPAFEMEATEFDASNSGCGRLPAPICKIKNIIESKVNQLRRPSAPKKPGCGGRKGQLPGHIKPGFLHPKVSEETEDVANDLEHPRYFRPHHPHGHHRHHHRHSFLHGLARGFAAVIIPTIAGVAVGMAISVVGLFVGRFVAFLWTRFHRGEQHGYIHLAADERVVEEGAASEEKIAYAHEEHSEAPPVYENAPAYEESGVTRE